MEHPIICIDFDGTIVAHEFPEIGKPFPYAIECLLHMKRRGWKLILYTCREDRKPDEDGEYPHQAYLTQAVEFLKGHGVEFDSINDPLNHVDYRSEHFDKRKPYADIYLDDKSFPAFPGWPTFAIVHLGAFWDYTHPRNPVLVFPSLS